MILKYLIIIFYSFNLNNTQDELQRAILKIFY